MINRTKLEHILEYARQQRHIGQHCKIPSGDMVEIVEIAMLQAGSFRENTNSSTNNFRIISETSTNSPAIPDEVLSAILKVARLRADFDASEVDRRGIGSCLDEAEQELIVTINEYASQIAVEATQGAHQ